jgi:hypothetical protein
MPYLSSDQNDAIDIYNLGCPALSAPMLRPTPTPTPSITPSATPASTPPVTPSVTPTYTPTPTPTPTVPALEGIVTIVDQISISEIDGDLLYPIEDKGIVTFLEEQIYSFDNDGIFPF